MTFFQELENVMVVIHGDAFQEAIDPVLTDPPYSTHRFGNRPNADHEKVSEPHMHDLYDACSEAMELGGYIHVICSDVRFSE